MLRLLESFVNYKLPKDIWTEQKTAIMELNRQMVYIMSLLGGTAFFVFSIFPFFIEHQPNKGIFYLALSIACFVVFAMVFSEPKNKEVFSQRLFVFIMVLNAVVLAYGLVIGVFGQPEARTVTFFMLFISMNTMFLIRLKVLFVLQVLEIIIFCVCTVMVKPAYIYSYDIVHMLGAFVVTLVLSWEMTHMRLRDIITTQKIKDVSITDPLTQIYNRRALEIHFGETSKKHPGLAFAILDLDFFKKVNDSYGHDIGDEVLRHVVRIVKENIPACARLYRWGGEEFLFVLETNDTTEVEAVLNSLCRTIEKTPAVFSDGLHATINITVSIGGTYPNLDLTIEECIHLADTHLYEAKASGRNRVVL